MPRSEEHLFSASYDTSTKVISGLVCVLLLIVIAMTQSAFVVGIGVLSVLFGYAYSPRRYTVWGQTAIIERLIGDVRIPLDGVREIRRVERDDFRGCLRLWGSGGFFGYYGLFRTSKLGRSTWYITNRRNAVVLISDAKTVLVSPDDVDGFITAVRNSVPIPSGIAEVRQITPARPHHFGIIGTLIGAVITVVAIALAVVAVRYSPGTPAYTLTAQSLTIHDRFYPVTLKPAEVDIDQIRVVDFQAGTDWRPTARTNGFANSHYRSGWFRAANGQKIRMYWATGTRLVLLPPKGQGTPVLLEVKEPDEFMQEIREKW